jgi:hypothetical protein
MPNIDLTFANLTGSGDVTTPVKDRREEHKTNMALTQEPLLSSLLVLLNLT